MTITAVLKWQNADATRDLNSRFEALFERGVLTGGLIVPVSGSLEIDLQPFTVMSNDGMLVTSDDAERLTIPLDQTNIIALLARHNIGADPTLTLSVQEASVFNGLVDKDDYIVFGAVTTISPATEVISTDISYALRDEQNRRGRLVIRGKVTDVSELPTDPNFNRAGDLYSVAPGGGSPTNIYAWDGLTWINITATAAIASDLAMHRANLFTNEIHLTDDQADAALGSAGTPNLSNRYVTELDSRLPTQNENNALQGSDGTPSSTNLYITEEYPIGAPTRLNFAAPPGASILLPSVEGPVYVGTGAIGSANRYFSLLDFTLERGYLNTSGQTVSFTGVFKDAFLTVPFDPSSDASVDANGFSTGIDLYLAVDNIMDSSVRLVYGKREFLNTVDRGFSIVSNPADSVIPAKVIEQVANIKGRDFDDTVPTAEQNINLRKDLDGVSAYIGSVLDTDIVAADEDFVRLVNDPVLGTFFEKNVGVDDIFTFDNTGLVTIAYTSSTGLVQYNAAVNLSGVRVGDTFTDGAGDTYRVSAVDDGADNLNIVSFQTGEIPLSITTSVGTSIDASTKVSFNPRDLLLSEMKFSNGAEVIKVINLTRKPDEFSQPDGLLAFGVVRHDNRFDPRLVFFGNWENYVDPLTAEAYVRNDGGSGIIEVTGFFTEIALICRRRSDSPALSVSIDGQAGVTVSTSNLGTINASIGTDEGPKYHRVPLANNLPSTRPTDIRASIVSNTAGSLDVYGIELVRSDSASVGLLESGRAFESARIVQRDTIDTAVAIPQVGILVRGGRAVYSLADNSFNTALSTLIDLDSGGTPSGTATGATITVTIGVGKLNSYRTNDLITISSASVAEIRRIASISSPTITLSSATSFAGDAVTIRHIASTDSTIPLVDEETFTTSYKLPDDFVNNTSTDFRLPAASNRFVMSCDQMTLISGQGVLVTDSDVVAVPDAVQIPTGGAELRITVIATRLDILAVNDAAAAASITVDGSPAFAMNFPGGDAIRRTIFYNARYQAHEVVITASSGNVSIGEIFLFGPFKPSFTGIPNEVADLSRLARYAESQSILTAAPNVYPLGAVFYEARHYLSYLDGTGTGTDWVGSEDYSKAVYGQYIAADREGANIEFYFLGQAFELQYITGPDHGIFKVQVDNIQLELTGGTIVGDYTGNQVDGYTALYGRRNIGAYGLSYGYHKVTAVIGTPRTKNGSSTGFFMAFTGCYVCNDSGYESIGLNREGVFTSVVDLRDFVPLDIPAEVPASTSGGGLEQVNKVAIPISATSVAVTLPVPYLDTNYIVTCNLVNTVDADGILEFQPLIITAQTTTGFTVKWNTEVPTGNYQLMYIARSFET